MIEILNGNFSQNNQYFKKSKHIFLQLKSAAPALNVAEVAIESY